MTPREKNLELALIELCRLKRLRDELGYQEKHGLISIDALRRALLKYGREKDAAWTAAYALVED